MKQYIIVGLIVVAGIATAWVVIGTLLSGGPKLGERYSTPEGVYDCYVLTSESLVNSVSFPKVKNDYGAFPLPFPAAAYEGTREFLGFRFRIGIYEMEPTDARIAAEAAFELIQDITERVDVTNASSEISRINREAPKGAVKLSDEFFHIIKRAMEVSEKSDGAFDITSGPLRWLWEDYAERGLSPSRDDTHAAVSKIGYRFVNLDEDEKTIRFTRKDVLIDLHDLIRGFICDDVAWFLRKEKNIRKGFISVDDNCFYLLGHPRGELFTMGVPDAGGKLRYTFVCDRVAVVTRGYFKKLRGVRDVDRFFSGIVNPKTGTSANSIASCTVIGPDAMSCEAIATAICVQGGSRVRRFIEKFNPDRGQ